LRCRVEVLSAEVKGDAQADRLKRKVEKERSALFLPHSARNCPHLSIDGFAYEG
jgi:hypothetical protein